MSVRGSSVAVVVTADRIIIAADSAQTAITNGARSFDTICKIGREGGTFYGAVGAYGISGTTSVLSIAQNAARESITITGLYDIVVPVMLNVLPEIVESNKISAPEIYAKWLSGIPVTSLIFAALEQEEPIAVAINFRIDEKGTPTHPEPIIMRGTRGIINTGRFGHTGQMTAMINSPSWASSFRSDPIGASRELIQCEIDASNREKRYDVGPPILIVSISKQFAGWQPGYEGTCGEK